MGIILNYKGNILYDFEIIIVWFWKNEKEMQQGMHKIPEGAY